MSLRFQNEPHNSGRVPSYYAGNKQFNGSYVQTEVPGRTSRRIHDGFVLAKNYGLDTVSDDLNSSIYSSPFYINGRYNSRSLSTQRGNSASVQGTRLLLLPEEYRTIKDFLNDDIQTYLELWQGKQIRFEIPYDGKLVGTTITLRNTGGCKGVLSILISPTKDGVPLFDTSIDLCEISSDKFEHKELFSNLAISATANPFKKLYVRMEIWEDMETCDRKRSDNPYNTGRKIEIAATGAGNHEACIYRLPSKDKLIESEFDYQPYPSRPLLGLIYSDWEPVPCDRLDNIKVGASVSLNGYRYDIFCVKRAGEARVLIYDKEMNRLLDNTNIRVDGRVSQLNLVQCTDTEQRSWVYYVDGHSPLQRFRIGEWQSEAFEGGSAEGIKAEVDEEAWYDSDLGKETGVYMFLFKDGRWTYNEKEISLSTYGISLTGGAPAEGSNIIIYYTVTEGGTKTIESIEFVDARPVVGASLILFHNNRIYLAGFKNDPNLIQLTSIEAEGPNFTQFPYRFYSPNRSPYDTSRCPITAMTEIASDQIMFAYTNGHASYSTYGSRSSAGIEDNIPVQISTFTDAAGVMSQGDIVNYKGIVYSFNEKEGIRRYTGSNWTNLPAMQSITSHFDRVDMDKPRKLWGDSNALYFNYTDKIDGKYKCIIWDQEMNYQSYPVFMDADIPFCDIRFDEESGDLLGIHPDYPAIMQHYADDTWRRFDSAITFRRDTKWISLPGNVGDIIVKRVHTKVLANATQWFYISILSDKHSLVQERGKDNVYRQPVWKTNVAKEPMETPFPVEDILEQDAVQRLSIMDLRIQCESVQVRVLSKTFRAQSNLLSVAIEVQPKNYL